MIEAVGLTKRYGKTVAVDNLSFTVAPGRVTGFLGPNGAGKSTTMRMILGLDRPTAGRVLIDGKPYDQLHRPLQTVGALLDAKWVHPNRSARAHLRWLAKSNGLPNRRVDERSLLHVVHHAHDLRVRQHPHGQKRTLVRSWSSSSRSPNTSRSSTGRRR